MVTYTINLDPMLAWIRRDVLRPTDGYADPMMLGLMVGDQPPDVTTEMVDAFSHWFYTMPMNEAIDAIWPKETI